MYLRICLFFFLLFCLSFSKRFVRGVHFFLNCVFIISFIKSLICLAGPHRRCSLEWLLRALAMRTKSRLRLYFHFDRLCLKSSYCFACLHSYYCNFGFAFCFFFSFSSRKYVELIVVTFAFVVIYRVFLLFCLNLI